MSKNNNFNLYDVVTQQLITILEEHQNLKFTKDWLSDELAKNAKSDLYYRGFNQIWLSFVQMHKDYKFNRWLTLKQGNEYNAKVKRKEKGQLVTFFKTYYINIDTNKDVTEQVLNMLKDGLSVPDNVDERKAIRYYTVFNIAQFENLPDRFFEEKYKLTFSPVQKNEIAEELVISSGAKIHFKEGDSCYYEPKADRITLCPIEKFTGTESYYSVLFHELSHWTGHHSRLDRDLKGSFGSKEYAFEELIAEFSSAFLSANCDFTKKITNNAAYIQSWIKAAKEDNKFAYRAASKAQKASDYILQRVSVEKLDSSKNVAFSS